MSFRPSFSLDDDAPVDPEEDEILISPEKILANMEATMPPDEFELAALRFEVQLCTSPMSILSLCLRRAPGMILRRLFRSLKSAR